MTYEVDSDKSHEVKVLLESAKIHDIEITEKLYLTVIDKVYGKGIREFTAEKSTTTT